MKKPKLVFAVALICLAVYMLFFVDRAPKKEYFMDSGYVLEESSPDEMFTNPKHERTKEFLARVLNK